MNQQTSRQRTPYVSAKRNEPLTFGPPPPVFDDEYDEKKYLAKYVDPSQGRLTYRSTGPSFLTTYSAAIKRNRELILRIFSNEYEHIRCVIETEYRISTHFFWIIGGIPYADINPMFQVLQRTFAGNLVAINSALELTLDGAYSNARPLLRQAFEGSMIAKLCSLAPSLDVYDRWLDGEHIVFSNDILRRIQSPAIEEFRVFWQCLSQSTHASSISGQPDLSNEPAVEAAPLNFIFANMLLEANYHLLSSHIITASMRYYQKAWFPSDSLEKDRKALRALFVQGKKHGMAKGAKQFIRDFRSRWSLVGV